MSTCLEPTVEGRRRWQKNSRDICGLNGTLLAMADEGTQHNVMIMIERDDKVET